MGIDPTSIRHRVGSLVGKAQPDNAIELLCEVMELRNDPYLDIAWQVKRRLRRLREKEMKGIIAIDVSELEESRICEQILSLAKWVNEKENST